MAKQVEYDMDEQGELLHICARNDWPEWIRLIGVADIADQEWLDAINLERKREQSGPIPYEVFEIIMDKLEKEWFALVRLSACIRRRTGGPLQCPTFLIWNVDVCSRAKPAVTSETRR